MIDCELLKYIRDFAPTQEELIAWFCASDGEDRFHVLRKFGLIEIEDGRVKLSPEFLSEDGKVFIQKNVHYMIDEGMTRIYVQRRKD